MIFLFCKLVVYGCCGINQLKIIQQVIFVGVVDYWVDWLNGKGIVVEKIECFGIICVVFKYFCGILYELVESLVDSCLLIVNEVQGVFVVYGIKGIYGVVIVVFDCIFMDDFFFIGLLMKKEVDNYEGLMFLVLNVSGLSSMVEILYEVNGLQGIWMFVGGMIYYLVFNMLNEENQFKFKVYIEGFGFIDVFDQKDCNYFKFCYVCLLGGVLFEIVWLVEGGWVFDEFVDQIGMMLVFLLWFEDCKQELIVGFEFVNF